MSHAVTLVARLPLGEAVSLPPEDARRLVAALWDVSTTRGAVVAIGKIEHGLARGAEASQVEVSELEIEAIRTALADDDALTPALARLRLAAG